MTAFASGWFRIAGSEELPRGVVLALRAFQRELTLFRGEDGRPRLADVRAPTRARLRAYPVQERYGAICMHHHPDGELPPFGLPEVDELEGERAAEWTSLTWRRWRIRGGLGDLAKVHGFSDGVATMRVKGPALHARLHYLAEARLFGALGAPLAIESEVRLYGPGMTHTRWRTRLEGQRVDVLQLGWATPVDGGEIDVRFGFALKRLDHDTLTQRMKERVIRFSIGCIDEDLKKYSFPEGQPRRQVVPKAAVARQQRHVMIDAALRDQRVGEP